VCAAASPTTWTRHTDAADPDPKPLPSVYRSDRARRRDAWANVDTLALLVGVPLLLCVIVGAVVLLRSIF